MWHVLCETCVHEKQQHGMAWHENGMAGRHGNVKRQTCLSISYLSLSLLGHFCCMCCMPEKAAFPAPCLAVPLPLHATTEHSHPNTLVSFCCACPKFCARQTGWWLSHAIYVVLPCHASALCFQSTLQKLSVFPLCILPSVLTACAPFPCTAFCSAL